MSGMRPKNDWLSPSVILTLVAMAITGLAAWNNLGSSTDKRLSRLEDRVELMWGEWIADKRVAVQ